MEKAIQLPRAIWHRLNLAWVVFFLAMGGLNIYVFSHYSEDIWVDFKLFGMLGLTLLFVIVQGVVSVPSHGAGPSGRVFLFHLFT